MQSSQGYFSEDGCLVTSCEGGGTRRVRGTTFLRQVVVCDILSPRLSVEMCVLASCKGVWKSPFDFIDHGGQVRPP